VLLVSREHGEKLVGQHGDDHKQRDDARETKTAAHTQALSCLGSGGHLSVQDGATHVLAGRRGVDAPGTHSLWIRTHRHLLHRHPAESFPREHTTLGAVVRVVVLQAHVAELGSARAGHVIAALGALQEHSAVGTAACALGQLAESGIDAGEHLVLVLLARDSAVILAPRLIALGAELQKARVAHDGLTGCGVDQHFHGVVASVTRAEAHAWIRSQVHVEEEALDPLPSVGAQPIQHIERNGRFPARHAQGALFDSALIHNLRQLAFATARVAASAQAGIHTRTETDAILSSRTAVAHHAPKREFLVLLLLGDHHRARIGVGGGAALGDQLSARLREPRGVVAQHRGQLVEHRARRAIDRQQGPTQTHATHQFGIGLTSERCLDLAQASKLPRLTVRRQSEDYHWAAALSRIVAEDALESASESQGDAELVGIMAHSKANDPHGRLLRVPLESLSAAVLQGDAALTESELNWPATCGLDRLRRRKCGVVTHPQGQIRRA